MGLFSRKDKVSTLPGPLYKLPQPVGLFHDYVDHYNPVVIAIHENQYSWGNENGRYKLMNAASGAIVFKAHFRWTNTCPKEIRNARDDPLFKFKMKIWSATHTFVATPPNGGDNVLFTIKNAMRFLSTRLQLSYTSPDGRPMEITLQDGTRKGSAMDNEGVFKLTSDPSQPILGYITPKPPSIVQENSASVAVREKRRMGSYYLTVAPGVDGALLLALCMAKDEVKTCNEAAAAGGDAAAGAVA